MYNVGNELLNVIFIKRKKKIFDCIVLRKTETSKVSKANRGTGGDYLGK
jgi:hypothetical protein